MIGERRYFLKKEADVQLKHGLSLCPQGDGSLIIVNGELSNCFLVDRFKNFSYVHVSKLIIDPASFTKTHRIDNSTFNCLTCSTTSYRMIEKVSHLH